MIKWVYEILVPKNNGGLSCYLIIVIPKNKGIVSRFIN